MIDLSAVPPATARQLAYGLQLLLHGITLGTIYGLLALGYSLVYLLIDRINLAFGQISMLGAYVTFLASTLFFAFGLSQGPVGWLALLAASLVVGAAYGIASDRLVFRPLEHARSQAPLAASIGLAVVLEELVRLGQGASERWLQPLAGPELTVAEAAGGTVTISALQLWLIGLALLLYLLVWLLLARTAFGRAVRACADDLDMASLCGVPVGRTVGLTFALGGSLAGAAGFVLLLRYGGIGFYDGFMFGFKALTAAVLGGIGSLPGAMLGGLLIGLVEVFWAGYLTLGYRDVAIFSLLGLILVLRPGGLLGQPARLRNDQFWRPTSHGQRW